MSQAIHASCDAASAQAARPAARPVPPVHAAMILAATILASSLAFVDGSVVNVGLPAIAADFHARAEDLQWVINAYLLPLSALLLLGGAAGDRFGRRTVLTVGTTIFAVASIVCAWAPSLEWLLAGRALQGLGAALLLPNSLAILGESFTGEARGRAIGVWAAMGAVAGAIGPVLGGWLIDTVGWRAIFLINLPLAAGAIGLALAYVHEPRPDGRQPLDWAGGVLATLSLGALTWGLTIGTGPGGWTLPAVAAMIAGLVTAGAFLVVEQRRGERAMMPLALFGSRGFVGLTVLTVLLYGALSGVFLLVPYMLMQAGGYSGTAAGAALLPFPLVMAAASPLMGGLAGRLGSRGLLTIGPLIVGAGFLAMLWMGPAASYWTSVLPGVLLVAVGMACAAAPLTNAVLSSVDEAHAGAASGFNSAAARTGGLVATALLGVVLAASGEALAAGFRIAVIVGAVAAVLAGLSAWLLVGRDRPRG
ncbi:DHA2 family efflux MFS transporter permease subunit [Caulobacter mirabilis]|uniref:MFS transporter n=1 Tax=Caulobacter mirabilis TaxID=69666 RepID=A0A2D2B2F3_9CAUL|nr:DHA2 family efflux MFS transporter permease subunit [Caulobacter mirabilis]ATQ44439.1 MFS transporter [Caulobacter mirabilis]